MSRRTAPRLHRVIRRRRAAPGAMEKQPSSSRAVPRWPFTLALLLLSLGLLTAGSLRTRKVYESDSGDMGILTFQRVRDWRLVEDATFTGVVRRDGRLCATYDRNAPRGKKKCPS
jgi:hypothetical protein